MMDTRERILIAASNMYLIFGVKNVTMDLLAAELGISKRTIYELFKDKDTLVIECIRHMIIEDNKELLKIIDGAENVVEAMFLITKRQDKRNQEFPKVFVEDIKRYFPAVNATFFSCKDDFQKFSASYSLIEKGMNQGIFRKDLKIELVDTFIHEIITLMHTSERIRVLNVSPLEILHSIFLPYFRGICTAKGLDLVNKYFEHTKSENL